MSELRPFWISWYAVRTDFELHSPWWTSGWRIGCDDEPDVPTICAAVMARDEEHARSLILAAYDEPRPDDLEWRFCSEKPAGWAPWVNPNGTSRFQRAAWMQWPDGDRDGRAVKAGREARDREEYEDRMATRERAAKEAGR